MLGYKMVERDVTVPTSFWLELLIYYPLANFCRIVILLCDKFKIIVHHMPNESHILQVSKKSENVNNLIYFELFLRL